MLMTVAKTVSTLVVTLLVSSFLVFGSLYLVPGDPLRFLLRGRAPSPEAVAALTEQYGFDQPFLAQYATWLVNVLSGNLGRSYQFRESVAELIASRLPTTVGLVVYSGLIILVVGIAAGIMSSLRQGRPTDRIILVLLSGFAAIPSFVASIVLIAVFAVQLGWFPVFGRGQGFFDVVYHLTLPSIALAFIFIAMVGRITRSSMLNQLSREHVEVARSRGLSHLHVVSRHVFRNSLAPITTVTAVIIAALFVASAIVEQSFGLAGIGSLLVAAVDRMDFPVVQAVVLLIVVVFVVANTTTALLQPLLDPRARRSGSAR